LTAVGKRRSDARAASPTSHTELSGCIWFLALLVDPASERTRHRKFSASINYKLRED